jgi:hypothetical protein
MNYQTYKTLTPEQKEEYNYRFKDKFYNPEIRSLMTIGIIFMQMFALFTFIIFMAQKEYLKIDTTNILLALSQFTGVIFITLIAYVAIWIINLIGNMIQYGLWIKKNKIKFIRWSK